MNRLLLFIIGFFSVLSGVKAQTTSSPQATTSGNGGFISITKLYQSSISPVPTGQVFTYQINFSISGNVVDLKIEDALPANLVYVSELSPSWLSANTSGTTVTWTSIPSGTAVPTGAFSINLNVKFKNGETCNGATALNSVSAEAQDIPKVTTEPISITASASDGWKIKKLPTTAYTHLTGSTVSYEIYIYNTLGLNGSHNLTNVNVTDLLPPGATLVTSNITTIPLLDVMASGAGNPYTSPYHFTVTVQFPAANYPNLSCAWNKAQMRGFNPCDQTITEIDSVQVCFLDTIPVNASGYVGKTVTIQNPVVGCRGRYSMGFSNNGNVTVNDFVFDDTFPTDVSVDQIEIHNPYGLTYQYNIDGNIGTSSSNMLTINASTPGFTPPFNSVIIDNVTMAPNQGIGVYANFIIDNTASTGQIIHNEAHLNSVSNSISETDAVDFTIQNAQPKIKVRKQICPPTSYVYNPGDEFVYRVGFQNYGSADFTNGVLDDILDSRLEFVNTSTVKIYKTVAGNNAYPPCSTPSGVPPGTIDLTGSTTFAYNASGHNFYVNLPNMPHDCDAYIWNGYNLINQLETYWVEFKVKVKPGTPPGIIPNTAAIANSSNSFVSNTVNITVNAVYQISAKKEISTDGGITYGTTPSPVSAGSQVKYRLTVENIGNVNMKNLKIVDFVSSVGDLSILGCLPRNSSVNGTLLAPAQFSSNLAGYYSNQNNPDVNPEIGQTCSSTAAGWINAYSSAAKSVKFESNPGFILTPGSTEVIYLDVEIPITATTGDLMCNDFAVRAEDMTSIPTAPFSSNEVCLEAIPFVAVPCCNANMNITKTNNGIINVPNGAPWSANVPLSIATETFTFQNSSVIPITEVNIRVTDIHFDTNNEECPGCKNNPALWGSIDNVNLDNIGNPATGLSFTDYPGSIIADRYNQRELSWKNSNGYIIQSGDLVKVSYAFPPFTSLKCCKPRATVCTEISWKDANCRVCKFNTCSTFNLYKGPQIGGPFGTPIQSVILNPNSVGLPRLTTEQIDEIEEPETGMMLWDVDSGCIKLFNGTEWQCVSLSEPIQE